MIFGDLFCGAGGTTTGAYLCQGVKVAWALNHSDEAIEVHKNNHPETLHYREDIRLMVEKKLAPVDAIWASLECTNHSIAKGGKPKNHDSRTLAWQLNRYVHHLKPSYLIIENVREFLMWGPLNKNNKPSKRFKGRDYLRWVESIKSMGYKYNFKFLNAADYGAPTRRIRYIGIFACEGMDISFPMPTHCQDSNNLYGLPKWKAVKNYINLNDEGNSIFGRKKPLVDNTLRRIAGGIKKFFPEMAFIMKYYGNGDNVSSINDPLHTITIKDRHVLVRIKQFISDIRCNADSKNNYDSNSFCTNTSPKNHLQVTEKAQFISQQYNSNGKPENNNISIDEPLGTITTQRKHQFISVYFNSSNNPESQNRSIDDPLGTIPTVNKHALVSLENFDIKMRFLNPDELSKITGFPDGYFSHTNLSHKKMVWIIGNAVPAQLAKAVISTIKDNFNNTNTLKWAV